MSQKFRQTFDRSKVAAEAANSVEYNVSIDNTSVDSYPKRTTPVDEQNERLIEAMPPFAPFGIRTVRQQSTITSSRIGYKIQIQMSSLRNSECLTFKKSRKSFQFRTLEQNVIPGTCKFASYL